MKVKGLILALSLALVMLVNADASTTKAEKILPSEVSSETKFDLAKTYDGVTFSSAQVNNKSIALSKSAKKLLDLAQIELKNGQILYPEEISVFIQKAKPPHEKPAAKPPHE